jgi:hypothetical protein
MLNGARATRRHQRNAANVTHL